jgi:CMP-N,N'-diacetyllegionaminic acid synthase
MNDKKIFIGGSRTVAIVPAKMTSQRLPNKNMANLCGNPLIYYSIQVAKNVSLIDEIYVSSEDTKVLDYAMSCNVKTILRPTELSQPHVTTKEVLSHSYHKIGSQTGKFPKLVVLLQPTHPLRTPEHVHNAIISMAKRTEFDSLFSVMKVDDLRGKIVDGVFVPEFPLPRNKNLEPKFYRNTGSFYIFRPERTFLTNSFFGEKIYPFILDRLVYEIDIDYQSDLDLAQCLLHNHPNGFPYFKFR